MNTYGIAAYKTRASDSLREVEMIRELGVQFRQKVEVGRDIAFADLEEQFDAIFIGVGLGETRELKMPGEDLHGVYGAIEFIEKTKVAPFSDIELGGKVACIGAGNTAVDVVTAARRLGAAAVYLIYRRGEHEASAFEYEVELAKKDSVVFLWQTQPVRVLGHDGVVTGLECVRTQPGSREAAGRGHAQVDCGQRIHPRRGYGRARGGAKTGDGISSRGEGTAAQCQRHGANQRSSSKTGNPKYFAGGDCTNGGKEVVDAVADGMVAARGLDAWLGSPRAVQSTN